MPPPKSTALAIAPPTGLATAPNLTDESRQKILEYVVEGHKLARCFEFVGVNRAAYNEWRRRAARGEPEYVQLFDDIARAEADAEASALGQVRSSGDWKAHAWYLTHRYQHWRDEADDVTPAASMEPAQLAQMLCERFDENGLTELIEHLQAGLQSMRESVRGIVEGEFEEEKE